MTKTKIAGASGRFGVRYGQYARRKITEIEGKQRQKQACPFCRGRVIRTSKGIWKCKRCMKKFAGHAYYLEKGAMAVKSEKFSKEISEEKKSKPLKKPESKSSKGKRKTAKETQEEKSE